MELNIIELLPTLLIVATSVTIAVLGFLITLLIIVSKNSGRFDQFSKRFDDFQTHVESRFDGFQSHVESRFDGFQNHVESRFDDFQNHVESRFNDLRGLFKAELKPINDKLNNHITDTDKKIDEINKKVDKILSLLPNNQNQ